MARLADLGDTQYLMVWTRRLKATEEQPALTFISVILARLCAVSPAISPHRDGVKSREESSEVWQVAHGCGQPERTELLEESSKIKPWQGVPTGLDGMTELINIRSFSYFDFQVYLSTTYKTKFCLSISLI